MPAYFDIDDVYIAVSEEALFAADSLAKHLVRGHSTSDYEDFAVICGAAFKQFFEQDHEMGLVARQKILRGMIERTSLGDYFETISDQFVQQMEYVSPELYEVLIEIQKSAPDKIRSMARTYWKGNTTDPLFLYGTWLDSTNAVHHLKALQSVMNDLLSLQRHSLDPDFARLGYKVHTPHKNVDLNRQVEVVYKTLAGKEQNAAQKFNESITALLETHPDFAKKLLNRFYYMHSNDSKTFFNTNNVLNDNQRTLLSQLSETLNAQFKEIKIGRLYAQYWAHNIVQRATHIMVGVSATNTVEVEAPSIDKDKIQERRAEVVETVRRSLARAT